MRKRILFSQNFLVDKKLVEELVDKSSINEGDVVYEIGAGKGIITSALVKKAKEVVAFEIDKRLFKELERKFQGINNLELKFQNFLNSQLPSGSYKVFSNIPFNRTSEIINKLVFNQNPPVDSHLVVQKEAAKKLIGKPFSDINSQLSVMIYPRFKADIQYEFKKDDFIPKPNVGVVLIRLKLRSKPLIETRYLEEYRDFVVYAFSQFKPSIYKGLKGVFESYKLDDDYRTKPSELNFNKWIDLFGLYLEKGNKKVVSGSYSKLVSQQSKLDKVHRTRLDGNWKKYKNL